MKSGSETIQNPSKVEVIKEASDYLRGTILEGLADDTTGAIAKSDTQLTKFHGIYQQDDRDLRRERRQQKLEKAFSFMVRIRNAGGICSPDSWLMVDEIADKYANGTIRLTSRQSFQLHGVLKGNLKKTIKEINDGLLDTIAACGDVNRNVMCNPNSFQSEVHEAVYEVAKAISNHMTPQTHSYHEIWLNGDLVGGAKEDEDVEPIYGKTYLPRKFKTSIAIPPSNDVDLFSQDLSFIAIVEDDKLVGFNVTTGGGMGMDHNKPETYPRLADVIGYITPDQVIPIAEAVVTTQRDFGDRSNRKHARLKYTIDDRGIEWFKGEVESRSGIKFQPERPFKFDTTADRFGWSKGTNGLWNLNLFIENGRVKDTEDIKIKTGLREIAKIHKGDIRITPNQNLIIGNIAEEDRSTIENLLKKYRIFESYNQSALRLNSMACVAMPTCGLALAESERQLPDIITKLETAIEESGLRDDAISIRMTGCPNGCVRPYLGEIGLVGRSPGKYNIYLGAKIDGTRLNKLYRKADTVDEVIEELSPIIRRYATERESGEEFGDFVIRKEYVKATLAGREFHD
jgi:sulfite reductase (NADPH) hemoprotein beta-component